MAEESESILKPCVMGALNRGWLAKGLHEVCKAIESRKLKFVVLAENCDEANYKKVKLKKKKKKIFFS